MEVLNKKLEALNAEIVRAENNLRIANNKLAELQAQREKIVTAINTAERLSLTQNNISKAVDVLSASTKLKDITQIKAEITKAQDILNTKEVLITSEVKI